MIKRFPTEFISHKLSLSENRKKYTETHRACISKFEKQQLFCEVIMYGKYFRNKPPKFQKFHYFLVNKNWLHLINSFLLLIYFLKFLVNKIEKVRLNLILPYEIFCGVHLQICFPLKNNTSICYLVLTFQLFPVELKETVLPTTEQPPYKLIMYYSFSHLFTCICLASPPSPSFVN